MAPFSADFPFEVDAVEIAPHSDLTVRVVEYHSVQRNVSGKWQHVAEPCKATDFAVSRAVMTSSSEALPRMMNGDFAEAKQHVVELHYDRVRSLAFIFYIFHDVEVPEYLMGMSLEEFWGTLAAADKYFFNLVCEPAKRFFLAWFNQKYPHRTSLDYKTCQMLLFPCMAFDCAKGFQRITHFLVYNAKRHITEARPGGYGFNEFYDKHHLPSEIIQQVNAAKGRLRTVLFHGLHGPIEEVLEKPESDRWAHALFQYEKGLAVTGTWPLEKHMGNQSMNDTLGRLRKFNPISSQSTHFDTDFSKKQIGAVGKAVDDTRKYFDGLCLDCMDKSKPKFGDSNEDYWMHSEDKFVWDEDCRTSHGEPTWYYSFMGRREAMQDHERRQKAESDNPFDNHPVLARENPHRGRGGGAA